MNMNMNMMNVDSICNSSSSNCQGAAGVAVDRNFLAGVALNNIGVALLSRGCYREARETIKDAITVMQCVLENDNNNNNTLNSMFKTKTASSNNNCGSSSTSSSSSSTSSPSYSCTSHVDVKVDKASKYLATRQDFGYGGRGFSSSSSSSVQVDEATYDGFTLRRSSSSSPAQEVAFPTDPSCSSSFTTVIPIRLDPLLCDRYQEDGDPDLVAGILCYNLGVSYLCLSRAVSLSSPTMKSNQMSHIAIRLFQDGLSTVLHGKDNYNGASAASSAAVDTGDIMSLEYVVLCHTLQAQVSLGNYAEANVCYRFMMQIKELQTMAERGGSFQTIIAAAAA